MFDFFADLLDKQMFVSYNDNTNKSSRQVEFYFR